MSLGKLVVSLVAESAQFISGMGRAAASARQTANTVDISMATIVKSVAVGALALDAARAALGEFTRAFETAGNAIDSAQALGSAPEKF